MVTVASMAEAARMVVAMAVERAAVRTAAALEGLVGTGCVERGTLARWRKRAR